MKIDKAMIESMREEGLDILVQALRDNPRTAVRAYSRAMAKLHELGENTPVIPHPLMMGVAQEMAKALQVGAAIRGELDTGHTVECDDYRYGPLGNVSKKQAAKAECICGARAKALAARKS